MPIESDCQLITALQRADAIRRACQHNVTGLEGKKLAHISDQRNDFMDHVRSRTLLALFAVYAQAQRCILRVAGKFRRGNKPGKRTRVIKRFSLFPRLPGFLHFSLNITQCQIERHAPTGTPVLVDGVRTMTVGTVSMDMLAVDLTPCPQAGIGTPVELWGKEIKIDDVAAAAGTVGYELMCALALRVPVVTV